MHPVELQACEYIKEAIIAQLANPTRAVTSPESSFVRARLESMGESELAQKYWSWCCSGLSNKPVFGEEVLELQIQLNAIDRKNTMPDWGTYGT